LFVTTICLTLAVSLAGGGQGTLVVLNKSEATASLIDLDAGRTVATVPTGRGPHEVAVSPDGRLAVACNYGDREGPGSTLTVIDVPGARVVKTIDLGEYRRPHGIVWLGEGGQVVVTAEENKAVLVVDVEAGRVSRVLETGQEVSHMVAATPDGSRAFVANIGSGSVTVLDLKSGEHLGNIPTGEGAEGIDVTPDGKEVWVTNRAADTVSVIDASTLKIIKEFDLRDPDDPESRPFPIRARATPDGKHVLVSNARAGEVVVFDAASKSLVRRIPMEVSTEDLEGRLFGDRFGKSSVPIGILIPPDGRRAYVANANADIVSVLDLEEWRPVGALRPGREPDGMAWSALPVREEARNAGSPATKPAAQTRPGG
jgi:YVTN family beta-propeller protein